MSQNPASPPLVLVDGSSYLFRAFYALPPLTNSKGIPTGAVKGVVSMIRRLMEDYPGSNVAVIFDAKGKTFRNDIYPEYKANRPPMPEELRVQIEPIHRIIEAMGLPMLVIEGVEADDVIGTLSTQAAQQQMDTVISTGDKDMAQLVNDHVSLVNTMNGSSMNREGVIEKFGIPPERIIDYLALVGDIVDNIPGVPKVGPKTAVKWLLAFDSMQGVIENAGAISGKVGENLRAHLDQLPLSHELATIKTDVELSENPESFTHAEPDTQTLLELFKELEFKGWVADLLDSSDEATAKNESGKPIADYQLILEESEFKHWLNKIEQAELVAVDTETTSLNYMEARLVGISLAVDPYEAAYIPFGHDYMGAPEQLGCEQVLSALKPFLEDSTHKKVGQNLKYDMNVLANHGVKMQGIAEDTMLQSYVINSTSRHSLDSLALQYLNHTTIHFEEVAGKGAKQLTFNEVELEQAGLYAAEDADVALRLYHELERKLVAEPSLATVYRDIEMPLVPVLSRIECQGALVDATLLRRQSSELALRMMEIEKQAYDLAGEEFNLGSPKQLQAIFYEKLNLPSQRLTCRKSGRN